jgi:hypothetical protein
VDLVLIKAPDVLCNARATVELRDNGRPVALEAVDRVRYYRGILPGLLNVRVLLLEERLFCDTRALRICLAPPSITIAPARDTPATSLNHEILNLAILGKEGL